MSNGEILRGKPGLPLYGKNGTILYRTAISMTCNIVISWSGGKDLDICAFYTHYPSVWMGYRPVDQVNSINDGDGFTASWGGDNTTGGPETVSLAYSGSQGLGGRSFEIHANWYSTGTDDQGNELSGGGPATISATDSAGNTKSFTLMPATSKRRAATAGDPGARLSFNVNGTLKSITAC